MALLEVEVVDAQGRKSYGVVRGTKNADGSITLAPGTNVGSGGGGGGGAIGTSASPNVSTLQGGGGSNVAAVNSDGSLSSADATARTTLASILAKLIAAPATDASLQSILAKLVTSPALDSSLQSILAKMVASPALDATVQAVITKLGTTLTANDSNLATAIAGGTVAVGDATTHTTLASILNDFATLLTDINGGLAVTDATAEARLATIAAALAGTLTVQQVSNAAADYSRDGTDANGNAQDAGGVGIRGWLSSIKVATQAIVAKLAAYVLVATRKSTTTVTTAALGASATFTGAWIDSTVDGTNFVTGTVLATGAASASAGFQLQQSDDQTNVSNVFAIAVSAGVLSTYYGTITKRYYRFVYINGTTAQTALSITATAASNAQLGSGTQGNLGGNTVLVDGYTSSGRSAGVQPVPAAGSGLAVGLATFSQTMLWNGASMDPARAVKGSYEAAVSTGGLSYFLLTAAMGTTAQVVKATPGRSARAHPNGTAYTVNVYDTTTAGGAVAATLVGSYTVPATGPAVDISFPHTAGIAIAATAAVTGQAAFTYA